jgi:hypothetical protein
VSVSAPQLTVKNGPFLRRDWRWIAAATSSLPVPVSPWTSTGLSVFASRGISPKSSIIRGLRLVRSSNL